MADPNVNNPTAFPVFPTQFTDKDAARLKSLSQQKTDMEKVYQQKFTPEAWAKTNPLVKTARTYYSGLSWLQNFVKPIAPTSWGLDYGATPDTAKEQLKPVEQEYKELTRMQLVNTLLPDITNNMMVAALDGKPMMSISEILPSDIKANFTDTEQAYLVSLADRLANASPEDILNGTVTGYQPSPPATYNSIYSQMPQASPEQIMSSVAFSKNLNDIGTALAQAFPPASRATEEELNQEQPKTYASSTERNRDTLAAMRAKAKAAGIEVTGDMTSGDIAKALQVQMAKDNGVSISFKNTDTGELMSATIKNGNEVWVGDEFYGTYDLKSGGVKPPMVATTNEEQSNLKLAANAFRLGTAEQTDSSINFFVDTLPKTLLKEASPNYFARLLKGVLPFLSDATVNSLFPPDKANFSIGSVDAMNDWAKRTRGTFTDIYSKRVQEHQTWIEEHPELQPKTEWADGSAHFNEPSWYFYVVAKNAPMTLAAMGTSVAVTALTGGNIAAGVAASTMLMTASQAQQIKEQAVLNGASEDDASMLAVPVGLLISALDSAGDIPLLRATSPTIMALFKKELTGEIVSLTMKQMAAKGLVTFTENEISETVTEVAQQAIQNAAIKVFNPNQSIFQDLIPTAYETAISTAPFGIFGFGESFVQIKNHAPTQIAQQLDARAAELEATGIPHETAQATAVAELVETPHGQAIVRRARDNVDATIPHQGDVVMAGHDISELGEDWSAYSGDVNQVIADWKLILQDAKKSGIQDTVSVKEFAAKYRKLVQAVKTAKWGAQAEMAIETPVVENATPTVESVATKIADAQPLTPEEEQFRVNSPAPVEAALQSKKEALDKTKAKIKATKVEAPNENTIDLTEKLPRVTDTKILRDMNFMSPQRATAFGGNVPRYWYHSPNKADMVSSGIKSYIIRESEFADSFGKGYSKNQYVWLSPKPIYAGNDTLIVDISKLSNEDMRFTGQAEGNLLHKGDIPESAIVRTAKPLGLGSDLTKVTLKPKVGFYANDAD